jgi:hypothetical protein
MRNLGISIYPDKTSLEDNIKYLHLAKKYGFVRLFVSLLALVKEENAQKNAEDIKKFTQILNTAKELGFITIADVKADVLKIFNASYDNLQPMKDLGLSGIRLDEGMNGMFESLMTYNSQNLLIEINASGVSGNLDNIISYKPNKHNLVGCHNFYPKKYSALSYEQFEESSKNFKNHGLTVAAFVSSSVGNIGPWDITEGLPTIEDLRNLPIQVQAKYLFYSNLVDDCIISTAFASEEELKALSKLNKDCLTLSIKLNNNVSEVEKNIAFNELHFLRGDCSDYSIRSTQPRVIYKKHSIAPANLKDIEIGDVFIENDDYKNYKGELHIALRPRNNDGKSNVIGSVIQSNIGLLKYITPWAKFRLENID